MGDQLNSLTNKKSKRIYIQKRKLPTENAKQTEMLREYINAHKL